MAAPRAALIWTLMAWSACVAASSAAALPVPSPQDKAVNAQAATAKPAAPQMPAPDTLPSDLPKTSPDVAVSSLSRLAGRRVHDIQFRSPAITDAERLRALLAQKAKEPLDKHKLRRSIQALYATGRFADIQVEAEPAPGNEISLVFVAKENYFVGQVTLTGAPRKGPTDHHLINASKLQLGELFTEEKLQRGVESSKRILEEAGYYRSAISPEYHTHPQAQQVDIHFQVVAGEQARIGQITVTGNPGYSESQISDMAKFKSGEPANSTRVTRALQRLHKRYQKQDRLEAQVSVTDRRYRPDSNTVDYALHIVRGPTVDIRLEGAKLRKGLIKKYVPVYEENAVDDDLLNEGARNLRDHFQTEGYFDVNVSFKREQEPGADHQGVIYEIDKGERHKLAQVALEGNKYFDDDLIRERMLIEPAGVVLSHGRFSQSILARDIQSIVDLYKANGFQQVKVQGEVQDDYQGVKGHMRVLLHITEGSQTRVAALKVVGNTAIPDRELLDLLTTVEGQPFSDANMAADRDAVVNYYYNRGFPGVGFESSAQPVPGEPARMNVTYKIVEGERTFVDRVLISGLKYTKPFVVRREVQIHDGDPLSQAAMLETQRRLYDLGIFNQVDIAVQNPEGQERYKDVVLDLREGKRYTFDYGLGFEVQTGSTPSTTQPQGRTGFSPRVSFDVTRSNFRGRDHTIVFKSHLGRLQQRALLSYEAPRWFNKENLKLTFNTFYDTTRDVRTFTAERLEGSVQAEQTWSKATTLLYRFTYRRVKVDPATLVIDPNLIPLLSKPVRVGMPAFTFIRDTRDDPIDSHKGKSTTFDAGISARAFGSQASFYRFLLQNSSYHSFHKGKYVFARSTRLGVEHPFGAANALIPLPERFFAGGGNSHRGFAINQAGPRDHETGFPLGGEALFLNNLELRLPPFTMPLVGEQVSPVFFHDMGNVFASTGDLFPSMFRVSQKAREQCQLVTILSTCDFNYSSHAIGGGIRYKTPIGPVRLDFGYNLNPPAFPIRREGRSDTLKRFNFFFSIGQTF